MKTLGIALTILSLANYGYAGCHALNLRHHNQQAVVLQQYAYPSYSYAVGADVQAYAMLRLAAEQGAAEALKKHGAVSESVATQGVASPSAPATDRFSLVRAECARCHNKPGSEALAALDMTSIESLTDTQKVASFKAMLEGTMPKGKQIDGQVMADIMGQLVLASNAPNAQ